MSVEDENKYRKLEIQSKRFEAIAKIVAGFAAIASTVAGIVVLQVKNNAPLSESNLSPTAPVVSPVSSPINPLPSSASVPSITPSSTKSLQSPPTPTTRKRSPAIDHDDDD